VKEQHVRLDGKKIVAYQVSLAITFPGRERPNGL